jgi:hypothetical protein
MLEIMSSRLTGTTSSVGSHFHMVRSEEAVWLTDEDLENATDPSFGDSLTFDTDYIDKPTTKRE